jgi:8-oxo-dGTP diphosphatase
MANRVVRVVAAVISRDGKYLITQRTSQAVLPNLWEFPGGRVEEGESDEAALRREVELRVGAEISVAHKIAERHHTYDTYGVHLTLYACSLAPDAVPRPARVQAVRWVTSGELNEHDFPPADQATMDQLLGIS